MRMFLRSCFVLGFLALVGLPAYAVDFDSAFYSNAKQTAFSNTANNVASGWYKDFSAPVQMVLQVFEPGTLEVRSEFLAASTHIALTLPGGQTLNGNPCNVSPYCRVFYIGANAFASGSIPLTVSIGAQPNPASYHAVHLNYYEDGASAYRAAYLKAAENTVFRQVVETSRLRLKDDIGDVGESVRTAMRVVTVIDAIGSAMQPGGSTLAVIGNAGETALEVALGFSDTKSAIYAGAALDIANGLGNLAVGNPLPAYQAIVQSFVQYGVLIGGFWDARGVADKITAQYMAEGLIRRFINDGTLFSERSDLELKTIAETYVLPGLVASGDCNIFSDVFLGCGFDSVYDQTEFLKSYKAMRTLMVYAADKFASGNFHVDVDHDGVLNTQDTDPNDPAIPALPPTPTANHPPVAVVSASATSVNINTQVTLNGLLSSDSDGDSFTYSWSLTKPSGSSSALSSTTSGTPTFTPDKAGIYTVGLRVNDGQVDSLQKNLVVTAVESFPNVEVVYEDDGAHIYISNLTLGTCQLKQIGTFIVPAGEKWKEIKFAASRSDLVLLVDDDTLPALDGNSRNCTTGYTQGFNSDRAYDYYPATNIYTWSTALAPGAKLRIAAFSYDGLSNGSVNTEVTVSTDLDGDGVPDQNESVACRNNPAETTDSDGDGVCDNADAFPNNPAYSQVVPVNLTASITGGVGGTVTSSTGGLNCPGTCTVSLNRGTAVALTAAPAPGTAFAGWSGDGCSGLSPICNVTPFDATTITASFNQSLGAPNAPAIGVATPGDNQATVVFSAPTNNGGSAITGYTAISSPGGLIGTCTAPCSSIVIPGLSNGTAYSFTVRAINSLGASSSSSPSNSVTPLASGSLPGAPAIVSAMAGEGSATITLTPPTSDGGNAIAMYSAVSSPGGFKGACLAPCSSIVVGGLTNGTAYTFTVNAINRVGAGPSSAPSTSVTPADTTPNAFTFADQINAELSTVVTSNTITVSGIDAASPISISGGSYAINGGAHTSSSGMVTNGQTVTVRATSSASYATPTNATLTIGGVSDTFSVTTKAAPSAINGICGSANGVAVPVAPTTNLCSAGTVSAFSGNGPWNWSCMGSNGGSDENCSASLDGSLNTYVLYVSRTGTGSGTVMSEPGGIDCGTTCSANFSTEATIKLYAAPSAGSSFAGWGGACWDGIPNTGPCTLSMSSSQSVSAIFQRNTPAPDSPRLDRLIPGNGSMRIVFTPPGSDGGDPITGFTANCFTAGLMETRSATGTSSPIKVTGLTNGASYTCFVTATNAVGTSSASASLSGIVRPPNLAPILNILLD